MTILTDSNGIEFCDRCLGSEKYHLEKGWDFRNCPFDKDYPCIICQEPVTYPSVGGTAVCPWCDMGICRYCSVRSMLLKEEFDNGKSLREWRNHMKWHEENISGN